MSRGRRPAPPELKLLKGETRPSRVRPDRAKAPPGRPQAPEWLGEDEREAFEEIVDRLELVGIASEADDHIITLAAMRVVEVRTLSEAIASDGHSYTTINRDGQELVKKNPDVGSRDTAMKQLQSLLSSLGLSPSDRGRVSSSKAQKEDNPYARLRNG